MSWFELVGLAWVREREMWLEGTKSGRQDELLFIPSPTCIGRSIPPPLPSTSLKTSFAHDFSLASDLVQKELEGY